MLNTFYYQLTHTTLRNVESLKHSKINKNAPTCFGLHGNRNMLERFYLFQNVLITLRFLTLCASVGNKKCSTCFILVHFFDFIYLFREFCKCFIVFFDEHFFIYGPVICFGYCGYQAFSVFFQYCAFEQYVFRCLIVVSVWAVWHFDDNNKREISERIRKYSQYRAELSPHVTYQWSTHACDGRVTKI